MHIFFICSNAFVRTLADAWDKSDQKQSLLDRTNSSTSNDSSNSGNSKDALVLRTPKVVTNNDSTDSVSSSTSSDTAINTTNDNNTSIVVVSNVAKTTSNAIVPATTTATTTKTNMNIELPTGRYATSWCTQFNTLFERSFINILRDPLATFIKIAQVSYIYEYWIVHI